LCADSHLLSLSFTAYFEKDVNWNIIVKVERKATDLRVNVKAQGYAISCQLTCEDTAVGDKQLMSATVINDIILGRVQFCHVHLSPCITCHLCVIRQSFTCHLPVILSSACYLCVIYRSSTSHLHVIYLLYTCHPPVICVSSIFYLPVVYLSFTCHLPVIYVSSTCCLPVICLLIYVSSACYSRVACHLHVVYVPSTCRPPVVCLIIYVSSTCHQPVLYLSSAHRLLSTCLSVIYL